MKKTFKGFTLVECLIAMAILAIAGTLMAEIYAVVSQRNNSNQFMNTSLANQMKYIEQYIDAETVPIYYGNTTKTSDSEASTGSSTKYPPHKKTVTTNYNYVKVTKLKSDGVNTEVNSTYSFPVDIYVMYSRDTSNRSSSDASYSQGVAGSNNNWELVDTGRKDISGNPIMEWQLKSNGVDGREGNDNTNNLRYKYILGHT